MKSEIKQKQEINKQTKQYINHTCRHQKRQSKIHNSDNHFKQEIQEITTNRKSGNQQYKSVIKETQKSGNQQEQNQGNQENNKSNTQIKQ